MSEAERIAALETALAELTTAFYSRFPNEEKAPVAEPESSESDTESE